MATSELTQGLLDLQERPGEIGHQVTKLYALDEELQAAHQKAKQDDEHGEQVVALYSDFVTERQKLIDLLQAKGISVPWQLRMRVDVLERTIRERKKAGEPIKQVQKQPTKASLEEEDRAALGPVSRKERVVVTSLISAIVVAILAVLYVMYFGYTPPSNT